MKRFVLIIAALLAATALALRLAGLRRMQPPIPNGWLLGEISSPMGPLARRELLLTQGYHLAAAVLWLTAASLAAGVVVGLVVQKRAGLWAAAVVVGFLGAVFALGGRPTLAPSYHPLLAAAGLLAVVAAMLGGWIGHSLGHDAAQEFSEGGS